jgi:predicted MFS family arabinose efflux permease
MNKRIRNAIIASAIVLVVAQALNAILAVSSFEKTYSNTLISNFRIIARDLKREIETGVNFGKPISLFSGMDTIFSNIMSENENIEELYVTFPDRKIIYSTDQAVVGNALGSDDFPEFTENPGLDQIYKSIVTYYRGATFISIPVYYNQQNWVGTVHLQFNPSVISDKVKAIIRDILSYFSIILIVALAAVTVIQIIIGISHKDRKKGFKLQTKNTIVILLVLAVSQLLFAYKNNDYFRNAYIRIFNANVDTLSKAVKNDLEYILDWDVPIERMKKAEKILAGRLKNNPQAVEITVTDIDGRALFRANLEDGVYHASSVLESSSVDIEDYRVDLTGTDVKRVIPLKGGGDIDGFLAVFINTELIREQLKEILIDALTVIVVAMIFSIELLRVLSIIMPTEGSRKKRIELVEEDSGKKLQIIRVTSFLFFFATLIPLSFLPIFIKEVFEISGFGLLNLAKDTVLSLPISSYMIGAAIVIPIIGFISNHFSIRSIFLISLVLFSGGTILSAFSTNITVLIIARLIAGFGYGAGIINSTNLIVGLTDSSNRTTGFGSWSGGFAAASICAISIGGVLVNHLGYRSGFFVATAFAVILGLFVLTYFKAQDMRQLPKAEKTGLKSFFHIFRNRKLVANLLFSTIPIQLAYIGLFQYVFPLYMNSMKVSQSNIGRILTIYGLIALITPLVSRASDRIKNNKLFIIIGNLITGVFLLGFFLYENLLLMIFTIIAMGIGSMIVDAVNEAFIISTKEAKEMGETKLMSIYTTYEKIIAVIVPILAGILITSLGFSSSIGFIGIFTIGGVILFTLVGKGFRTRNQEKG